MTFVVAENLRKTYVTKRNLLGQPRDRFVAVSDVSFAIERGQTLAVVGESGAGKSTLARLVMRLIEPDSGTIRLGDDLLTDKRGRALRAERVRMQMIFQDPYSSLDPTMTIGQSVAEPLRLHQSDDRARRDERVFELLDSVGIRPDQINRYPEELSGGQLQRVAIARAIATSPEFIVCDEPVSALDLSIRAHVLNILRRIQSEQLIAYLFITHDLSLVRSIADRVAVMRNGAFVEEASVEEIFDNPQDPYTKELFAAIPQPNPRARRIGKPLTTPSVKGA